MPLPFRSLAGSDAVHRRVTASLASGLLALTAACKSQQPAGAGVSQVKEAPLPMVSYVLRGPQGPAAGYRVSRVESRVHGPYNGIEGGIEEGRFLYVRMNCAYCHGFDGTGGMGPDLTDASWRYGAADADVFESIYLGRAKGMPAWGPALTQDQIWKLVAYVRSLGGSVSHRGAQRAKTDQTRKTSANTVEGR